MHDTANLEIDRLSGVSGARRDIECDQSAPTRAVARPARASHSLFKKSRRAAISFHGYFQSYSIKHSSLNRTVSISDFLDNFHSLSNIFLFIFRHAGRVAFETANVCATHNTPYPPNFRRQA
ncbi:hypothetical protein [Burkholderia diffusa]|uniref:hypothetical protein n=1 Tax=Burkholderia diffusa TaxID=488732 RepID=UPI0012D97990|nr:hypothetical protein [Burkholderia diffusa]